MFKRNLDFEYLEAGAMNPSESNISNAATTLRKTIFRIFGRGLRLFLMVGAILKARFSKGHLVAF